MVELQAKITLVVSRLDSDMIRRVNFFHFVLKKEKHPDLLIFNPKKIGAPL